MSIVPSLGALRTTLILAALLGGLSIAPVSAAAPCTTLSMSGDRRPCTVTEEFGTCLAGANDAYWQCRRSSRGLLGKAKCAFFLDIDLAFCFASTGISGIIGPVLRG